MLQLEVPVRLYWGFSHRPASGHHTTRRKFEICTIDFGSVVAWETTLNLASAIRVGTMTRLELYTAIALLLFRPPTYTQHAVASAWVDITLSRTMKALSEAVNSK